MNSNEASKQKRLFTGQQFTLGSGALFQIQSKNTITYLICLTSTASPSCDLFSLSSWDIWAGRGGAAVSKRQQQLIMLTTPACLAVTESWLLAPKNNYSAHHQAAWTLSSHWTSGFVLQLCNQLEGHVAYTPLTYINFKLCCVTSELNINKWIVNWKYTPCK